MGEGFSVFAVKWGRIPVGTLSGYLIRLIGVCDQYVVSDEKAGIYKKRGSLNIQKIQRDIEIGRAAEYAVTHCMWHLGDETARFDPEWKDGKFDGWMDITSARFGSVSVKATERLELGWTFQKSDPMNCDAWALCVVRNAKPDYVVGVCFFGDIKNMEFGEMRAEHLRSNKFALYPKDNAQIIDVIGGWRGIDI